MHPDEQVVTGEAVALELRPAGAGSRGVAAMLDLLIITVIQVIILFFVLEFSSGNSDAALATVLIASQVLIILGYPVAMETLWRGRTLGKAAMGLRVVRDDGGPIRFRHALVRGLVGVVLDKPGTTFGLGALLPMIWTRRKKRLGDLAAGTIVLQDRVPGRIDAPILMPPPLAHWAAGLDLSGLDDALALRMRHFIGRANQLTPSARATLEHQLATEAIARVGAPPADAPGWAVISAILAERRRRAFEATQSHQSAPAWPSHQPTAAPSREVAPSPAEPTIEPAAPDVPAPNHPPSTTGYAPPS